jgi:hypothetical protein
MSAPFTRWKKCEISEKLELSNEKGNDNDDNNNNNLISIIINEIIFLKIRVVVISHY